ncbi:MAG: RAMP superfamily CRISPR-associated protein [Thiobacillaceae bacterium]|nr:RAMP superfamily CRISPR-associated protein [Thiobacillaceae bacterium]
MARRLTRLFRLTGTLVADQPLHVGGLDELAVTDQPVARDGFGRPYLPGTSLAGALFAAMGEHASAAHRGAVDENKGPTCASRVLIEDAPLLDGVIPELWDGVGIDRVHGAAAARIKYDREVLPAGSRFAFTLSYEADGDDDFARAFMGRVVTVLQRGLPLGASTSRGLGRVRLEGARGLDLNWHDRNAVLSYLSRATAPCEATIDAWHKAAVATGIQTEDGLDILVQWRPRLPLMVKAGQEGLATDVLPFVSRLPNGTYALALPGSGLKGALREQAERIVRSVRGLDVEADAPFHETVDVPIVRELFGLARRRTQRRGEDSGPGRGLLTVDSVYANQGHLEQVWRRLADEASPPPAGFDRAMHVAIDRWTGGAAEAFLYSAAEPSLDTPWQPIRLRYRPRPAHARQTGEQQPHRDSRIALHLALLWLVLEDLRAGRIALGFGKNRGYGAIVVASICFEGSLAEHYGLPAQVSGQCSLLDQPPPGLRQAWQQWLMEDEA